MEISDSSPQAQEAELVKRLCHGDPSAMEQIFRTYFDHLYSLVFHQVGRNRDVAEDIVQEIFLSVLDSASRFHGRSKLYTWLCGIAYHKIADFYRQQRREARDDREVVDIDAIAVEQNNIVEPPLPNLPESEETRYAVEQALFRLPLDYRQAIVFKYVEEMSVREISEIMQRSPKSVEGLLARGRRALREILVYSSEGLR